MSLMSTQSSASQRARGCPPGELPGAEGAHSPDAAEPPESRPAEPRRPRAGRARDPRPDRLAARRREEQHAAQPVRAGNAHHRRASASCSGSARSRRCCADPAISDILVNRCDQIYVEREGKLEATDLVFKDDQHLLRIIERIVSSVGRRIDESSPMVDARLADGSRVNAIIPPLALDGPVLSIRRFRTDKLAPQDLVARQSLTQPMLEFLKAAVRRAPQHPRLRRHRRRQDDVPQRALQLHLRPRTHRDD